ncbi:hypothetical protein ABAC402_05260 [Asticcacaulis sp. AC402]|nr:hypothetical protein ABAC402_05260 [Asticcacaulis sp. AC402]
MKTIAIRLFAAALLAASLSGCIIIDDRGSDDFVQRR